MPSCHLFRERRRQDRRDSEMACLTPPRRQFHGSCAARFASSPMFSLASTLRIGGWPATPAMVFRCTESSRRLAFGLSAMPYPPCLGKPGRQVAWTVFNWSRAFFSDETCSNSGNRFAFNAMDWDWSEYFAYISLIWCRFFYSFFQ